ncbi:ANTAR domain-containing protein [Nocardioides sp. LHG3406-4]|uniref:GAF domain-containing protein n=1 Tax=Nocardioides sp. LHG3406-4 TaxID=2804575 RepID=UPI003CFA0125
MISIERLTDVFVEVADTLVDDFDVIDFLHHLTGHAASISGSDAVGLLLADVDGQLQCVASSNESGRMLELLQLQAHEGPCLDCYLSRAPVVNADLTSAGDRWPVFAPAAIAAGFHSVHAFPMRLRDRAIGALNLFGRAGVQFTPEEVRVVQSLADIATIALLQERDLRRAEAVTEQLQGALNSRIVIEQAKGAVAQLEGTSPSEAFQLLRSRARASRRRLADVAAEVLQRIERHRDSDRPP